jgi:primosomal protein N' (replication factor Y) (superfamily II helicase)
VLTPNQLALARWIAREYAAPLGRCCALMVPPGFTPKSSWFYEVAEGKLAHLNELDTRIVAVLRGRGQMLESKLRKLLPRDADWRDALERLVKRGVVLRTATLQAPRVAPQRTTLVQLIVSESTLALALAALSDAAAQTRVQPATRQRRAAALTYLQGRSGLAWADWIFAETGATRADLSWLAEQGYVLLGDAERWRDPLADVDYIVKTAPPLTSDQQSAWDAVSAGMRNTTGDAPFDPNDASFLLRGVTGSGKTEVYMRAVDAALRANRGALVLVPEIALTPQTSRRFLERFPGKVALIHSRLKPGERLDTWRRIRAGELPIVVGARSALFAPLPNVGLIVLDEEHDPSYKQATAPHYDARRAAMHYAALNRATLVLGSATPSLEALSLALDDVRPPNEARRLALLDLPNRVRAHAHRVADQQARLRVKSTMKAEPDAESVVYQPLPDVEVIDMRAELRGGNTAMFSGALNIALTQTLQRREQAILFLNRRGAASSVVCRDCGHVVRCPDDDTPLTLHRAPPKSGEPKPLLGPSEAPPALLKCHTCGRSEPEPRRCPACNSARIRFLGIGTQTIEDELHKRFPTARVVRWDKDTASARDAADQMLRRFQQQQADVLVGTQMIAKGLDLPMVTLVGVVMADVGLFLPDFRASERVFNLLEQVAGRAGRSLLPGRVIVQTYNPEQPPIQFAARHDVRGFARHELANRRNLLLPPFVRLVKFETLDPSNDEARARCEAVARLLRARVADPSDVIGPAACYFAKRDRRYRWQVLARTTSPGGLLQDLTLPDGVTVDVDPGTVL